jgi:hypothetical protein
MGYLSVVILDLHIVSNFRRNMLMCTEWFVSSSIPLTSPYSA